jgi:hypothetical protein
MKYEDIIKTVSEIIENEAILKENLTLEYRLNEEQHRLLNEDLWKRSNPITMNFIYNSEPFEVEVDGIVVRFVK